METNCIYINLPVTNLDATRQYWEKLGFSFLDQYSSEDAICMVLKQDTICVMFLTHQHLSKFTKRPIATPQTTQVLLCIQVESKELVDQITNTAIANGGSKSYDTSIDHDGWMYYNGFADLNGHQWEVMFYDASAMPTQ